MGLQKNTLNDFYRRDGRDPGLGFGKRVISGGGNLDVHDNPNARKTKKNMAKIQCKACGQVTRSLPHHSIKQNRCTSDLLRHTFIRSHWELQVVRHSA